MSNILGTIYKNGKAIAEGDEGLKDPWDIHFELVRAVRLLEQLKKGSDRAAIFSQIALVEDLRVKHLAAVLGSHVS